MSSLARPNLQRNFSVAASTVVALFFACVQQPAHGQSLVVDFKFDSGDPLSQAAVSGQTYTVDVFATVTGTAVAPATTAQLQQLGIQLTRFAARSSVTAGGSFAAGAPSSTGANAGAGAVVGGAGAIQNPFNNPGQIGPVGDYNGDGINDLGGATRTTISIAQNSSSTQFGGGSFGSQVGTADSWRWLLEQFTVTPGATTGKAGTTKFTPTLVGTGASTWTTDGATTADNVTPWTVGSSVTFAAAAPAGALEDNSNTAGVFGPPQSFSVAGSGPYNVVDSSVVGQVAGTTGGNTAFPPIGVGGRARILAGTNSSATGKTVTMGWRSRLTPSEVSPAQHPPMPDSVTTGLVSDVVDLNGLGNPSDPFVLDMTYNPALLPKHNAPGIETSLANNKLIYMVSPLSGIDGTQYVNTVAVNTGNVVTSPLDRRYGYVGSYAAFQADAAGGNGGTPGSELGAWGVDTALHEVWAVVDHNSTFAVVPEPSTMLLAGFGLLGLVGLRRRLKKVA